MSNIYPESLPNKVVELKRGEAKVFEIFKSLLPKEWNVYYSVSWNIAPDKHNRQRDLETDFILTHPEYGVLVFEVKGGQEIICDSKDEEWVSIDLNGDRHNIKDPYKQARKNKYTLIDNLLDCPGFVKYTKETIYDFLCVGYGVIFPDVDRLVGQLPASAPKEITIFGNNLDNINKDLSRILNYYSKNKELDSTLPKQAHLAINARIASSFVIERTLNSWIQDEEKKIIELSKAQYDFFQISRYIKKASIYGCAGSGKTLLAIRKAEILAEAKQYVLIVCYNILLGQKFKEHFKNNPYVSAGHHYQLMADRLNLPKPIFDDEKLIDLTLSTDLGKYDAIIIDEAQDFSRDKIDLLKLLLKEDGIEYYFWDDNQQVNQREINIPVDKELVPLVLDTNLRNTTRIFETVKNHYHKTMQLKHSGPLGRNVEILDSYSPSNEKEWFSRLEKKLNSLITIEKVQPKDIVILTFKGKDKSSLKSFSFTKPLSVFSDSPTNNSIRIDTVRRFKGMESKVVIVTEMDDESSLNNPVLFDDMCYVSFSRAVHHLIILPPNSIEFI